MGNTFLPNQGNCDKQKRRLGIAGVCLWAALLAGVVAWSYFNKPASGN